MLLRICEALEHSWWAVAIDNSRWIWSAMAALHFFSFFILIGTTIAFDLRLLGIARRVQSPVQLARQLFPWTWLAVACACLTGFIMFAVDATIFFPSTLFRIKVAAIVAGILISLLVQSRVRQWDQGATVSPVARVAAVASLVVWIGVVLAALEVNNYSPYI